MGLLVLSKTAHILLYQYPFLVNFLIICLRNCRRVSFVDTKSLAGQIRAACEAKDAVYIKNQTVTLDAKLAKFVGRAGERSKVSGALVGYHRGM